VVEENSTESIQQNVDATEVKVPKIVKRVGSLAKMIVAVLLPRQLVAER
jgi:hypothetical protein